MSIRISERLLKRARTYVITGWGLLLPTMFATPAQACGIDSDCKVLGDRHYRIHMTDGATGALVFAHGFGGSAKGVVKNTRLLALAEQLGLALVALKSAEKDWSIANAPSKVTRAGVDEVAYVDAVMADVAGRFGIEASKSYVSGFSAGGMMAWTIACQRGDMFAGYVPMAGVFWQPEPERCDANPASVTHLHGRNDKTVPLAGRPVLDTHQGSVAKVIDMYARHGAFGEPAQLVEGEMTCQGRLNPDGLRLELCLFNGGHTLPIDNLANALSRLLVKD